MIKEDMEFMGPVRLKDVEEAQQKIVNVIRKLEDSGDEQKILEILKDPKAEK